MTFPDIATEIVRMAEADQLMRTGAFDPDVDRRNTAAQEVYRRLGMNGEHYQVFEWMK